MGTNSTSWVKSGLSHLSCPGSSNGYRNSEVFWGSWKLREMLDTCPRPLTNDRTMNITAHMSVRDQRRSVIFICCCHQHMHTSFVQLSSLCLRQSMHLLMETNIILLWHENCTPTKVSSVFPLVSKGITGKLCVVYFLDGVKRARARARASERERDCECCCWSLSFSKKH